MVWEGVETEVSKNKQRRHFCNKVISVFMGIRWRGVGGWQGEIKEGRGVNWGSLLGRWFTGKWGLWGPASGRIDLMSLEHPKPFVFIVPRRGALWGWEWVQGDWREHWVLCHCRAHTSSAQTAEQIKGCSVPLLKSWQGFENSPPYLHKRMMCLCHTMARLNVAPEYQILIFNDIHIAINYSLPFLMTQGDCMQAGICVCSVHQAPAARYIMRWMCVRNKVTFSLSGKQSEVSECCLSYSCTQKS